MRARMKFYKECNLSGRQYHDADIVWNELGVGTDLLLERDRHNKYDRNAVAVVYKTYRQIGGTGPAVDDKFLLGYIPAPDNEDIAKFLDMGWNDIFTCTISKKDPAAHYENQIRLTIRINPNHNKH